MSFFSRAPYFASKLFTLVRDRLQSQKKLKKGAREKKQILTRFGRNLLVLKKTHRTRLARKKKLKFFLLRASYFSKKSPVFFCGPPFSNSSSSSSSSSIMKCIRWVKEVCIGKNSYFPLFFVFYDVKIRK